MRSDLLVRAAARLPRPVRSAGSFWSVASSVADDPYAADQGLVDLMLEAASEARSVDLSGVASRSNAEYRRYVECWPGEHYKFLAGLVQTLRPKMVVEVGTFRGHSALSLLAASPDVQVTTFDVVAWTKQEGSVLRADDFTDGRLKQVVGDLSQAAVQMAQADVLAEADLIFLDGPKDGLFEQAFVADLLPRLTERRRIVGFDDIRMLSMVDLWRTLPYAKIDATSVGHWAGTGLMATRS